MGYELYSWKDSKGDWAFCILGVTDREKTVKEVFNKKATLRGLSQLKEKLSSLPEESIIIWYDRVTSGPRIRTKGSEKLKYPPADVVEEVKRFAAGRGIKINGP
jgi:hypothetical protein